MSAKGFQNSYPETVSELYTLSDTTLHGLQLNYKTVTIKWS